MKILSTELIKEGVSAKTQKPWFLVKATFEGTEGTHSGFLYQMPKAYDELGEVEFFKEDYQGKPQNKFKLAGKKKAEVGGFTEQDRTRMMRIESLCQNINEHLMRMYKATSGDKTPVYPTPETEGIDIYADVPEEKQPF